MPAGELDALRRSTFRHTDQHRAAVITSTSRPLKSGVVNNNGLVSENI